jgi:uncharacterized protein
MKNKEYVNAELVKSILANTPQITFEITDLCNLDCVYCGYGKLYADYDERTNKKLDFTKAKLFLDYLSVLWNSSLNKSLNNVIHVSFYGGEPLLNVPFIEKVIGYTKGLKNQARKFAYSMTTNGVLLDKYMDFLSSNDFRLLISLDGDEFNNSYRVNKSGRNSYSHVIENIDKLKLAYPEYFNERVNFNAVLHNRNSVTAIFDFFKKRYNKVSRIGALNTTGIRPEMQEEFLKMYQNTMDSLFKSENYGEIESEMFLASPTFQSATVFLMQHSEFKYENYNELLFGKPDRANLFPTGTCLPFSKKVFITVNGKILPCERIGHRFALGEITNDSVNLDFEEIAQKYNTCFAKLDTQCLRCYNSKSCIQCIFNLQDIEKNKCCCNGFMNEEKFQSYTNAQLSFLARHPDAYSRIMNDVIYR